ncbi:low temperature requirement protein A [Streptomyces siamensis]|uniref:Low temperature requirement protein A n=1 Tax=Streptomyces siamensis TaxID=1274986 RepID=A0ABP9IY66_9ACTN
MATSRVAPLIQSKRINVAEHFYDLVLVFAVNKVTHTLADDVSWTGLVNAWAVFTPFWWSWVGTGILSNLTDLHDVKNRLRLFAITLITSMMTIAAPTALHGHGLFFAGAYLLLRALLLWWAIDVFGGLRLNPFSVSAFFTAPLLLLTAGLGHEQQRVAWAVLMAVELSSTFLLRRRLNHIRVDVLHLPERFGLVVILALGVPFVDAGGKIPHDFSAGQAVALGTAFLLVASLWWIYFHLSNSRIAHQLRTEDNQSRVVRELLAYGHYCLLGSVSAIAVGVWSAVAHPRAAPETPVLWLMCAGAVGFHTVFAWPRWRLPRSVVTVRLTVAAVAVLVPFVADGRSGLLALGLLTVPVTAAAVVETALVGMAPSCHCGCRPKQHRLAGLGRHLHPAPGGSAPSYSAPGDAL